MKKQVKVVMLPTEKATIGMIAKCIKNDLSNDFDRINRLCLIENKDFYKSNIYWQPQHLYFISDEEIKEGDWQINHLTNKISNRTNKFIEVGKQNCSKIIATTDSSLNLPRPSNEFIIAYCNIINNNAKCDEVLVKYVESYANPYDEFNNIAPFDTILYVAPDNTITVYPISNKVFTFKEEELLELLKTFTNNIWSDVGIHYPIHLAQSTIDKTIINLKSKQQ